jgi:hypothetical protein
VEALKPAQIKALPQGNFVENCLLHVEHTVSILAASTTDVPRETTRTNCALELVFNARKHQQAPIQ